MISWERFQRPQRYLGNEWNVVKKNHKDKIRIVLCFPDVYEVGMSNLGVRIIYGLLNDIEDVVCERVFMPGLDFANYLKRHNQKLFSLETKTPLDEFDVIGVNLNYELNYTNFLYILNLGGIPLRASKRKKVIVLGGGIANPEPLAEFVDVFFLGEFEEKAYSFVEVLRKYKNKEDRLKALAEIEGFYIPKFYECYYDGNSYIFEKKYKYAKLPIKKVYIPDLDSSYYPLAWLTPYTQIVHDRVQIEVARGCPHRCYFCQAWCSYYPYREKSLSTVWSYVEKIYKNSGYENFSFLALSISDYSRIESLIERAVDFFYHKRVRVSLPSLRVDDIILRLYKKLEKLKKISLTLAIEAAGSDLRTRINKSIDLNIIRQARDIFKSLSLRHIKLYFMFGLPQETDDDIAAIPHLIKELTKDLSLKLNVSINVFVPKPFSVFQNKAMEEEEKLIQKKRYLLEKLRGKNIRVSISNIKRSILEGIIARGDRDLGKVIYRAYLYGACFDSYREHFDWRIWLSAFQIEKIDYHRYIDIFPHNYSWSHIRL